MQIFEFSIKDNGKTKNKVKTFAKELFELSK